MPSTNPRYAIGGWKKREWARRTLIQTRPHVCALCGQPIDMALKTYTDPKDGKVKRHPYSCEVDEIVPVSRGGSPTDLENLQLTHRICNQRKGNRMECDKARARSLAIAHSREW